MLAVGNKTRMKKRVGGIPLSYIPVICGCYTVGRHTDQNPGCSEVGANFAADLRRARSEPRLSGVRCWVKLKTFE